jgi:phage FluMu protein Com
MTVHCPKCGDILTETPDGQLKCLRGRMDLAQELTRRLRDCYVTKIREPKDTVFTHRGSPHPIGGRWFCPGCGGSVEELTPGDLRCQGCSKSLVEFVHSLIERHPHFDGVGGWK